MNNEINIKKAKQKLQNVIYYKHIFICGHLHLLHYMQRLSFNECLLLESGDKKFIKRLYKDLRALLNKNTQHPICYINKSIYSNICKCISLNGTVIILKDNLWKLLFNAPFEDESRINLIKANKSEDILEKYIYLDNNKTNTNKNNFLIYFTSINIFKKKSEEETAESNATDSKTVSPSGSIKSPNKMLSYLKSITKKKKLLAEEINSSKLNKNEISNLILTDLNDAAVFQNDPSQNLIISELSTPTTQEIQDNINIICMKSDVSESSSQQSGSSTRKISSLQSNSREKFKRSFLDETYLEQHCLDSRENLEIRKETSLFNIITNQSAFIPVAYIPQNTNFLDIPLANGLKEITDLIVRVNDNEAHLLQLFTKYIKNPKFNQELIASHSTFVNLQMETERKSHFLAHEMWQQQFETNRSHERSIQNSLNTVIKYNRKIQEENGLLQQKYNELLVNSGTDCSNVLKGVKKLTDSKIEILSRSNNQLRAKVSSLTTHLEIFEKELQKLQRQNKYLDEEMLSNISRMQNYKAMLQRTLTDREVEEVSLSNDVLLQKKTINDAFEAIYLLIEDFNNSMKQLKPLSCYINSPKIKDKDSSLPDLIYAFRTCINEIFRKLTESFLKLESKERDNISLKAENNSFKNLIASLENDKKVLHKQLEKIRQYEEEVQRYERKIVEIQSHSEHNFTKLDIIVKQLESEKVNNRNNQKYIEELHNKLLQLDQEKNELHAELKHIKLRVEIDEKSPISEIPIKHNSNAEMVALKEKIRTIEIHNSQILEERNNLKETVEILIKEKQKYQDKESNYENQLQKQQTDLETLNKSLLNSKDQLEFAQSTMQALQLERLKHLEQKHSLETKIECLKNHEGNLTLIKDTVVNLTVDNDRLLTEIGEKEKRISNLQTDVKNLDQMQREYFQDRSTLDKELSDLRMKSRTLDVQLQEEITKNAHLNDQRREYELQTQNLVKSLQEKQHTERLAVKELLKDFNEVVDERNKYEDMQKSYSGEVQLLKTHLEEQWKIITSTKALCEDKSQMISHLESKLRENQKELQSVQNKEQDHTKAFNKLQNEIECMKVDKNQLQDVIPYLKANVKRLQEDLDGARAASLEMEDIMNKLKGDKQENQFKLDEKEKIVKQLTEENNLLNANLSKLSYGYEALSEKSELTKLNLCELDAQYKEELQARERKIENLVANGISLLNQLDEKSREFQNITAIYETTKKEKENISNELEHYKLETAHLMETMENLQNLREKLEEFKANHINCAEQTSMLKNYIEELKCQLHQNEIEMEKNYNYYKSRLQTLQTEYSDERENLQNELLNVQEQSKSFSNEIEIKDKSYSKLEQAHKDLAGKLFKAIKMLIDEKCTRQASETQTAELIQLVARLQSEKESQERRIEILNREQMELTTRISELTQDKQNIQNCHEKLQESYTIAIVKCNELEHELNQTKSCHDTMQNKCNHEQYDKDILDEYENKLQQSYDHINDLKEKLQEAAKNYSLLEFKQCEHVLRLHDVAGKLETEEKLNREISAAHESALSKILEITQNGGLTPDNCNILIATIRMKEHNENNF